MGVKKGEVLMNVSLLDSEFTTERLIRMND